MESISTAFGQILADIGAGLIEIGGMFYKFSVLILWAFVGVFILFCVFISTVFYPKWEKWAESLKK